MPRVFISYARDDLSAVQKLEHALQSHDIVVWRDQEGILRRSVPPNLYAFAGAILSALQEARTGFPAVVKR